MNEQINNVTIAYKMFIFFFLELFNMHLCGDKISAPDVT